MLRGRTLRLLIVLLLASFAAGCIAETEPNNTGAQAQNNNTYTVPLHSWQSYSGSFPAGDTDDYWRFNPQSGQLVISGVVDPGKRMHVDVRRCSGLDFASLTAWPTCHSYYSVWSSDVGSASSTTLQGFVVPTQTATNLVVVGCFV